VRDGIIEAWAFAEADPYRAATHNKGILNGVDAVVIATGTIGGDRGRRPRLCRPLRTLYLALALAVGSDGGLEGELEMPMAVGTVGGATRVHPAARAALELMGVRSARELAEVIVSVGLAQNLAALRALATEGIQRGHMGLHARQVAIAAGATGEMVSAWRSAWWKRSRSHRSRSGAARGPGRRGTSSIGVEGMSDTPSTRLLRPTRDVGILGYGAYIPQYRLPAKEVARVWTGGGGGLPIKEKAVAGQDEDVITMSIEAARNALARARIDPTEIRAVWVGSESHPYAVKPTSTIVAEAIGATPHTQAADWEFACKAGTEALQAAIASSVQGWLITRWRSAWTSPRDGQAMRSSTPPPPAGPLPARPGRGGSGGLRGLVLVQHRHAGLLAARR